MVPDDKPKPDFSDVKSGSSSTAPAPAPAAPAPQHDEGVVAATREFDVTG